MSHDVFRHIGITIFHDVYSRRQKTSSTVFKKIIYAAKGCFFAATVDAMRQFICFLCVYQRRAEEDEAATRCFGRTKRR